MKKKNGLEEIKELSSLFFEDNGLVIVTPAEGNKEKIEELVNASPDPKKYLILW